MAFEVILLNFRIGDMVQRKSYNKDIIFTIDKIVIINNESIAILKGATKRLQATAPLSDLEMASRCEVKKRIKIVDNRLDEKAEEYLKRTRNKRLNSPYMYTGRILHLDGDKKYSEKSIKYYKKLGLNAVVRNIPESRQPYVVTSLLNRYNPDILVMTGHDAILKRGKNYNDLYNYRNSKYFVNGVKEARKWGKDSKKLVIFARCMSKLF